MKRLLLFSALLLLAAGALSITPKQSFAQAAPTRRIFIEEFTGTWCGWCPRGAYAIQQLRAKYPGQVFATSIHINGGVPEPMENAQGDSLSRGVPGLSSQTAIPGFPSGWVQRIVQGTSWVSDPANWYDSLTQSSGIVDQMISQPAEATVALTNVSMDLATHIVTAKVTATAISALTGDIRMNLIVSEDSVTGPAGLNYEQHNYYAGNSGFPTSPYYNKPAVISGFEHMQVYRMSAGGVWGTAGIIPASAPAGGTYTQTYTFRLPATVLDPNHVHLTAIIHRYSGTDASLNDILDAADVKLNTSPVTVYAPQIDVTPTDGAYTFGKSNGDTIKIITYSNNESAPVVLHLSADQSQLPTGWTAFVSPSTLTVPPNAFADDTLTVHAPEQSAFVSVPVNAIPYKEGTYSNPIITPIYSLSDNTRSAIISPSGIEASLYNAVPAAVKQHMALLPLNSDVIGFYPISSFDLAIFDNPQVIDGDGIYGVSILQTVEDLLSTGKKVFLSSDLALVLQNNNSLNAYTSVHTDAADAFFVDTLGVNYRTSDSHTANNSYVSFPIHPTSDPIMDKVPALTAIGSQLTAPFDVTLGTDGTKPNSVPLFYFDNKTTNNAGIRYTNPATGAKMVYLGFNLGTIAQKNWADTVASRSIAWLLGTASAVAPQLVSNTSMSAYPNPFNAATQIQYTAAADEKNVSFSVVNLLGQEIGKLATTGTGNTYTAHFDASTLANGTYVIVAHSSKGTHEVRVVTEH